jgi:Poxvirus Late Transcription Factor VLTF3 like
MPTRTKEAEQKGESQLKEASCRVIRPMENASRQLQAKFDIARSLFEKSAACITSATGSQASTFQALSNELAALEMRFALSTAHLYISARGSETGRLAATGEFARVLAAGGFASDVDRLVARGEAALREAGVPLRAEATGKKASKRAEPAKARKAPATKIPAAACVELQRLVDTYPRLTQIEATSGITAFGAPVAVDYEKCGCGGDMAVDAGRSELYCAACGAVRELVGTVFEDSQFYNQEGQRAKSGTFNPNRHFQFWWAHILAREPEEEIGDKGDPDNNYGEKVLEQLRRIVDRDRKVLRMLTVNDVRAMLREIDRTEYNKNVPLILKKLTGVGPPSIPDEIQIRAENLFTKAIEAAERVRQNDRVNRNYYPSYVSRILEYLIPKENYELCRVFYYIYVQSKETVEADDATWEQICNEMVEIPYVPTDRFLGAKYPPV